MSTYLVTQLPPNTRREIVQKIILDHAEKSDYFSHRSRSSVSEKSETRKPRYINGSRQFKIPILKLKINRDRGSYNK
ncbi:hypothetical protein GWI33_013789 [Rhynchophorus ferrugineus]|uniref:Uncharacterized protein n=1 Tax=Rhynchophorus ferrugineus TaxID=354439 RepID=A0A834IGD6_RHYFE|nr:hypothetical protein GWI33_013789 [Rhynchophorus ferrugineus]